MIRKMFLLFIYTVTSSALLFADNARVTQIDTSELLINQNINVYVSVTDERGAVVKNLTKDNFELFESADGKKYKPVEEIIAFKTMANYESGINFQLLVDNSGSMYRDMNNRKTRNRQQARIHYAKDAIRTFLKSITNPKDKIGLAEYNSYYTSYSDPVLETYKIESLLDKIQKPSREGGYSEIYSSIYTSVNDFKSTKGRKVIIILSDGVNLPFYKFTKKKHKVYGTKIYTYKEPLKYCLEEGITVFAVHFGQKGGRKDSNLSKIAHETGGAVFDANDSEQLKSVYNTIVEQVVNEYTITYDATMDPADKKYVRLLYKKGNQKSETNKRFYYSSTIFGLPLNEFSYWLIPFFILPFILLGLISMIKFEKKKTDPYLEVLNAAGNKTATKMFSLNKKGKTIIGGSTKADMTIIGGHANIREKHASIVFNTKTKKYTLIGEGQVAVNNKKTSKRVLETGDVINIGGSTIVFDDGDIDS